MNCIFCGQDSSNSKSVEHIVPESFGNKTAILRKGIVCDKCNNYFARKVEQPFLESDAVRILRQELEVENKRGKLIKDYAYPRTGEEYVKQIHEDEFLIYTKVDKTTEKLAAAVAEYKQYLSASDKILFEENAYTSRLLAKMAVEYFVYICNSLDEVCDYVASDEVFQAIRQYARYGSRKIWKYNARRIYARNEAYEGDPFRAINWEADLLLLGNGEIYFIIVMFGIEYAICMNGPMMDGYKKWLKNNHGTSPLYVSKDTRVRSIEEYVENMFSEEQKEDFRQLMSTKSSPNDKHTKLS